MDQDTVKEISALCADKSIEQSLEYLGQRFAQKAVFSTSFSEEDQVITHMIYTHAPSIGVFTLDTGRFFEQTYKVWDATDFKYGTKIKAYFPQREAVEAMLQQHGPNSFYDSLERRKMCCDIRKVEPLSRALAGKLLWVTGLRAEHSPNRQGMELFEWDPVHNLVKYNPLLHWSGEQVKAFIKQNCIPYNKLHEEGFVSIGCEPCTRAIKPGEDFRAGRWWWEDASKKECGLHVH